MTLDDKLAAKLSAFSAILNSPSVHWLEEYKNMNKDNKRIHIKLHKYVFGNHVLTKSWGGKSIVEKTLDELWKSFGSVTDTFYESEFGYCFVTFATHEEAEAALEKVNSNKSIAKAAKALIQRLENAPQARAKVDQIISFLLLKEADRTRASWAWPRDSTSRSSTQATSLEHNYGGSYYDSIPDGFTEAEWDAYCNA